MIAGSEAEPSTLGNDFITLFIECYICVRVLRYQYSTVMLITIQQKNQDFCKIQLQLPLKKLANSCITANSSLFLQKNRYANASYRRNKLAVA